MSLIDGLRGFWGGLRKGPMIPVAGVSGLNTAAASAMIPVTPGLDQVAVVNTMHLPTNSNVPATWSTIFMGPGKPFAGMTTTRSQDEEKEPRTMQYLPNINSTIAPRIAWGLTPFAELRAYAESVPEVAGAVRLLTEEMKAFVPTLVDDDDKPVVAPELEWMITKPDMYNPWPVWLSRFLYNVLVYDAPAVYKMRPQWAHDYTKLHKVELISGVYKEDEQASSGHYAWWCDNCHAQSEYPLHKSAMPLESVMCWNCGAAMPQYVQGEISGNSDPVFEKSVFISPICGLRIIDGSTLFALIDERGEQPAPPAPAFTQVIWGVPRMYLNTYQVWYRPRHLRADAPYGRSFIEDSLPAVRLLQSLWDYEGKKYTNGNISDMVFSAPADWGKDAEKVLEFEEAYNTRMAGNINERAGRVRFMPAGTEAIQTKDLSFNETSYGAAKNAVQMSVGIPKSESGDSPEGMLGGSGYAEAMQSSFYRMGLAPLQTFIEGLFDEILRENGRSDVHFRLKFPSDSLDPEKEESKWQGRFMNGLANRDEARQGVSMKPLGGEEGQLLVTPGKGGGPGEGEGGLAGGNPFGGTQFASGGPQIPVTPGLGKVPIKGPMIAVKKVEYSGDLQKGVDSTGAMVAIKIPEEVAKQLLGNIVLPPGSETLELNDFHVTLALFGDVSELDYESDKLMECVNQFVQTEPPLSGKINGYGRFIDTDKAGMHCIYANFDSPQLSDMRTRLVNTLNLEGCPVKENHGFTPHITVAYIPADADDFKLNSPEIINLNVDGLMLAWGPDAEMYPLSGSRKDVIKQAPLPEGVDYDEYMMGMEVEREHDDITGGDPEKVAAIVLAHLGEVPDYYTRLKEVEKIAGITDLAKHCGVCPEDDEYFGTPVKQSIAVLMPHQGANTSRIVAIGNDEQPPHPAVWKPSSGESPKLREWVGGELYRRAEAAYLLDRELATNSSRHLVPVTYMDEGDSTDPASVQHYVKDHAHWKQVNQYGPEWIERAAVFDYISGQVDRHNKNWLTHPDDAGRMVLIDNDLSFPVKVDQHLHSDFTDAMRGAALTPDVLEQVYLVAGNKSLWEDISEALNDQSAADYAQARAQAVVDMGMIPVQELRDETEIP
jgi:2'-5' RNA ligase